MAVTITIAELIKALRLTDSADETAEVTRLLDFASEAVTKHAPNAPDSAHNEAVRRVVGYLHDQPEASMGDSYANAMRSSGAARALLPYRIHRAGYADAMQSTQAAIGSVGNPVTGLDITNDILTVTFADGTTEDLNLPAGGMFSGTDQTARDAAAAAQTDAEANAAMLVALRTETIAANKAGMDAQATADANALSQSGHAGNVNAHHVPPMGGGGVVSESTRLPGDAVAMRMGWTLAMDAADADTFLRSGNHPTDGATEGTTAGLDTPPIPPTLAADEDYRLHLWIAGIVELGALLDPYGDNWITDFTNQGALTVDGVAGIVYSEIHSRHNVDGLDSFTGVIPGDLIASQPWVTEQIAALPAPTVAAPSWHWFATFVVFATQAAGVVTNGTFRTGPFGAYLDPAAVRAGITSNAIPQLIVYFEEVDSNGLDSDVNREVVPTSTGFGESAGTLNVFEAFTVGGSPKKFAIDLSGAVPTLTLDFAYTVVGGGQEAINVRVGVWA